jgi:hypothetical protein
MLRRILDGDNLEQPRMVVMRKNSALTRMRELACSFMVSDPAQRMGWFPALRDCFFETKLGPFKC